MIARALTLRAAFERFHLPAIRHSVTQSTISGYRNALASWDRFGSPRLDVASIRQSSIVAFRNALLAAGRAPATFDSKWRYLRAILNTLVEDEILDKLPRTGKLKPADTEPGPRPTVAEFERLYQATGAARWPSRHVPARQWWACLYAVAYMTALRRSDLLSLRFSEHVQADGIRIVAHKTRRTRKQVFIPFDPSGVLLAHLDAMRAAGTDLVFPIRFSSWYFAEQQQRISTAAGVDHDRATLQPMRRASLDAWLDADERAAGLIAGHDLTIPRVTRRSYTSRERVEQRIAVILRDAVERFDVPVCLRAPVHADRQLRLF